MKFSAVRKAGKKEFGDGWLWVVMTILLIRHLPESTMLKEIGGLFPSSCLIVNTFGVYLLLSSYSICCKMCPGHGVRRWLGAQLDAACIIGRGIFTVVWAVSLGLMIASWEIRTEFCLLIFGGLATNITVIDNHTNSVLPHRYRSDVVAFCYVLTTLSLLSIVYLLLSSNPVYPMFSFCPDLILVLPLLLALPAGIVGWCHNSCYAA